MPLLGNGIYADQVEYPEIATDYSRTVFIGGTDTGNETPTPEVWPGEGANSGGPVAPASPVEPVSGGSFIPFAGTSSGPSYDFSGMFSGAGNREPSLIEKVVLWVRQMFS